MNFLTAGAGSTTPVGPTACTRSTCLPKLSLRAGAKGEVHGAKAALSNLHWKLDPAWLEVNLNFGLRLFVFFFGPLVIVVSGANVGVGGGGGCGVWTVNERAAIAELPAASVARTLNR